jgi:hypothetical protein
LASGIAERASSSATSALMNAPPLATFRSAATSCVAALSFVKYPDAPDFMARTAY